MFVLFVSLLDPHKRVRPLQSGYLRQHTHYNMDYQEDIDALEEEFVENEGAEGRGGASAEGSGAS